MAESIQEIVAKKFPRLYHYGPAVNRRQIERFQTIFSSDLIRAFAAGTRGPFGKRSAREVVDTPLGNFTLNDQGALKYRHVKHPNSLTEQEFVALLDQFAFFWPGYERCPIKMGQTFVRRYQERGDSLVGVVVSTSSFMATNSSVRIFVSDCNSGAPRSNPDRPIYRGSDTFIPLVKYDKPIAEIKEIAVLGYARLPEPQISELTGTV